jgi:cupin 2 domain-containing protein
MRSGNLYAGIPAELPHELTTVLATAARVRIERIVSRGHASPPDFWYDQDQDELVLVVAGRARVLLEGQPERALGPGDWLHIRAHARHRVTFTTPSQETIWFAVFFDPAAPAI